MRKRVHCFACATQMVVVLARLLQGFMMALFQSSTRTDPATPQVPRHIAIIMDGNGRWAKQRFLPRVAGHQRGVATVREIVKVCRELGSNT